MSGKAGRESVYLNALEIRGVMVAVYVHQQTGEFRAQLSDDEDAILFTADQLSDLRIKLMTATKHSRTRVEVRFTLARSKITREGYQGTTFTYGTATGFHSATGHLTYRMDDGTIGQWRTHSVPAGIYEGILDSADQIELIALTQGKYDADRALQDWNAAHAYSLHDAVSIAVKEAAAQHAVSE